MGDLGIDLGNNALQAEIPTASFPNPPSKN